MEAFIEEFNHDHMKYKCEICCFGKAHVMTAAGGVGIYKLGRSIGLLYDIVITVYQLRHGRLENIIELLLILTPVLLDVICLVFLFMAIKRLNRRFLLIFLIGTGLQTLLLTVLITILWVTLSETLTRSYNFFERDEVIEVAHVVYQSIFVAAQYWFFYIVFRCYMYLQDYERFRLHTDTVVVVEAPILIETPLTLQAERS